MSVQTKSYIEDMNKMYEIIIKKENLTLIELTFLELCKRTMNGSITA
jgi:hypothetical protein